MLRSQASLGQASNTGGALGMTDDCLDASDEKCCCLPAQRRQMQWHLLLVDLQPLYRFLHNTVRLRNTQFQAISETAAYRALRRTDSVPGGLLMSRPALAYVARMRASCASWLGMVMPVVRPFWLIPVSLMTHSIVSPSFRA